MSSAAENKQRMQHVFKELEKGNGKPFFDIIAEDVEWTVRGTTSWSKTYRGKQTLLEELFRPLQSVLAERSKTTGLNFIADGDYVVVEGRGNNVTKRGERYDNDYCQVFRLRDGRVQALTEYLDTELTTRVLGPRPAPMAHSSSARAG